jgi:CPA2 family monovalent cation:H+ antiporter-2
VGPYGLGWITNSADTRLLAEFGVVFLLFTVGLEFSFPQLIAMKKVVLGLGSAQVILTTAVAGLTAWLYGMSAAGALVTGGVLAMSSTAIVIKQLTEQLELGSRHGTLSVGILLFQDVAVIPFLILIPALSGASDAAVVQEVILTLAKGVLVVVAMIAVGHWLLRPLFHEIALSRSSELFTLTALLFTLAAAWLTHYSGLSLALGAFLAGMMLGETEFRHQVEANIRPFRDVLLGLFFVTIGMLLDVQGLPHVLYWSMVLVAALIFFKTFSIMGLCLLMGFDKGVAMRTGVVLAQGGEFGFALLSLALSAQIVDSDAAQIILAALIISMAFAPLLIRINGAIVKRLFSDNYLRQREQLVHDVEIHAKHLADHTIICGYGRIGQNVARFLDHENIPYLALDLDPVRVRDARAAGERVYFGDATHREMLEAAGLYRAKALVVSFDDIYATIKVLQQVRRMSPELPILVRTRDDTNLERLQAAGATEVVPETLEASLMLSSHLLLLLGIPVTRVLRQIKGVRDNRYQMMRQYFHGAEEGPVEEAAAFRERLQTITLTGDAYAVGKRLTDLHIDEKGVLITALKRGGIRGELPQPEMELRVGDSLILYGAPEDLKAAEARLLRG